MSEESKFFKKCKCSHCSLPVSYPNEMAGKTIECPHCKCQTLLTEDVVVEKVVEKPPAPKPSENRGVVHNLEYVGDVILSLGFFGMVAASICVVIMHYEGADANQTLLMIIVAIVAFLPALVVKYLLFSLAEIIRLLRSIDSKLNQFGAPKAVEVTPPASPAATK